MNMEFMENALTGLDSGVLDAALSQRHAHLTGTAKSTPVRFLWRAGVGVAAVVALVCGLMLPRWQKLGNTASVPPLPTGKPIYSSTISPNLIPAYSTPTPEEAYSMEPFASVLPRQVLHDTIWHKSYKLENDPRLEIYNPCYLSMYYRSTSGEDTLSITVTEYDPNGNHADLNDPTTYKYSVYYGAYEQGCPESQLASVFGMIPGEAVTEELMNDRIYVFKDGLCKAGISVICGDHVVDYHYSSYDRAITGQEFYNMVVSSHWFAFAT